MSTYRDTAQHAAEAVSVSVAQGRSFIARCEDLDREMVKVNALAGQVCVPCPPTTRSPGRYVPALPRCWYAEAAPGPAVPCSAYTLGAQHILTVAQQ